MPKVEEGDTVLLRCVVDWVSDNGAEMTVRIPLYGYPVTLPTNAADDVVKAPKPKAPRLRDKAD